MTPPRRRIVWPVLAVLTLLVIGGCGLLAFTTCNPPDHVTVRVKNIPADTRFLSLAAIADKSPVTMLWSTPYPIRLGPPEAVHPAQSGGYDDDYHGEILGYTAYWKTGHMYGVVMQTMKGEWRVAWFPAAEVPLQGQTPLGGGKVEFDLSKAEIVPLDADTVKALGLQDVKPQK